MKNIQIKVAETSNTQLFSNLEENTLKSFFLSFESKLTSREYIYAAKEFLNLVANDIGELKNLKRHHLIFYQDYLKEKGLASKTILKKLSAISSLCKHLAFEGIVDRDLSYGLKRPKGHNSKETADFSEEEVRKIFSSLDPTRKSFTSHRAILAVGFYTGLRAREIRTLRIKNLSEVNGHRVLSLLIKGNKPHEIPLTPFCYNALMEHKNYLEILGLDIENPEQCFFPSLRPLRNKPISHEGLRKIFQRRLRDSGIHISSVRRYTPHSMRATVIGHLLNEKEVPLERVQEMVGHSSPLTTKGYDKRKKSHDTSPAYKIEY